MGKLFSKPKIPAPPPLPAPVAEGPAVDVAAKTEKIRKGAINRMRSAYSSDEGSILTRADPDKPFKRFRVSAYGN